MISSLDQHSAYLNPEIYQELQVDTRARFGGVGLEITMRNGAITIVSPIEDGPAARAGIQPGDQLLAIGDVPRGAALSRPFTASADRSVRGSRSRSGGPVHQNLCWRLSRERSFGYKA